jgi:beta-glucosidase
MADIHAILGQMTLEEKAALCTGAGPWTTVAVERLGVPAEAEK